MVYDDLLKTAIAHASNAGSIRQAALKIGITDVALGQLVRWRKTGRFPSDETLSKIIELSGEEKIKSHFATMAAKAKDPEISAAYTALLS